MQRRWIRGLGILINGDGMIPTRTSPRGPFFFSVACRLLRPGRLGRESTNPITQSRYSPPTVHCLPEAYEVLRTWQHAVTLSQSDGRTGRVGRVLLYFGIGKEGKAAGGCDAQTCNMGIDVFVFLAAPRSPSSPGLCPAARPLHPRSGVAVPDFP